MDAMTSIPTKALLVAINQLFDLEQKADGIPDAACLRRNIERIRDSFKEMGFAYESPVGQKFHETRTDVEAHIAGGETEELEIVEVLKPIIRFGAAGISRIIQKGVVIVRSRKGAAENG
jgi:hypothetical protein